MNDKQQVPAEGTEAAITDAPETVRTAHASGFPCKQCGSQMAYSPESGALHCPYCNGREAIVSPAVQAKEYLFYPDEDRYEAPHWETRGDRVLTCPSCGAETVMSMASMTATCPFCGANYVNELDADEAKEIISPETMTPFRVGEAQARAGFDAWVKKRVMAPRAFRRGKHKPELKGVYVPYWTFDASLDTSYRGEGGRRRTVRYTVVRNGKTEHRTRTVTDWYPISGQYHMDFDDMPCAATRDVNRKLMDQVGPFSLKVLHVYNPAFLAGFFAERYSVSLSEGFAQVRKTMEARIESAIRNHRNYDTYRFMQYRHNFQKVRFKHILLPLWLSSYAYRNKVYQFLVNGETGKVAGNAPVSAWKMLAVILGTLAVVGAIVALSTLNA